MELQVPFRELINVVTLAQALIFAGVLLMGRFRQSQANRILIISYVIIATVKIDQLFQMMGGVEALPMFAFIFTPIQWLLTPSLYFFVVAKINGEFEFSRKQLWHLLPALASFTYLSATYYFLPLAEKFAYIESGQLQNPIDALFIPLASDLIQLGYLVAAQRRLADYGVTLRNWFSRVDDDDVIWVRRVITIWMVAFVGHMLFTVSLRIFEWYGFALAVLDGLNIVHLLLVNALMMLTVVGYFTVLSPDTVLESKEKYAGSGTTREERRALYSRARQDMREHELYLQMDLTLGDLAEAIGATPRDLSEAINGEGGVTFYDFVNNYRVAAARQLLLDEPGEKVLSVAFRSGFNSKSTFNKAFKAETGQSPSEFRKTQASA
jgi:AraC-like DNA-binding protein